VHPLFWHLRNAVHAVDEVPREKLEELTPKRFYQEYLTMNLPVIVEDGAASWKATKTWGDLSYLAENFGEHTLMILRVDRGGASTASNDILLELA
jgi:hypothetical protein